MGAEPVLVDDEPVGHVTSAGWGASVERSIAYAWIPRELEVGREVAIRYVDRTLGGLIVEEPLFDPRGLRLRA